MSFHRFSPRPLGEGVAVCEAAPSITDTGEGNFYIYPSSGLRPASPTRGEATQAHIYRTYFLRSGKPNFSRCSTYNLATADAIVLTLLIKLIRSSLLITPLASNKLNVCEHFRT